MQINIYLCAVNFNETVHQYIIFFIKKRKEIMNKRMKIKLNYIILLNQIMSQKFRGCKEIEARKNTDVGHRLLILKGKKKTDYLQKFMVCIPTKCSQCNFRNSNNCNSKHPRMPSVYCFFCSNIICFA